MKKKNYIVFFLFITLCIFTISIKTKANLERPNGNEYFEGSGSIFYHQAELTISGTINPKNDITTNFGWYAIDLSEVFNEYNITYENVLEIVLNGDFHTNSYNELDFKNSGCFIEKTKCIIFNLEEVMLESNEIDYSITFEVDRSYSNIEDISIFVSVYYYQTLLDDNEFDGSACISSNVSLNEITLDINLIWKEEIRIGWYAIDFSALNAKFNLAGEDAIFSIDFPQEQGYSIEMTESAFFENSRLFIFELKDYNDMEAIITNYGIAFTFTYDYALDDYINDDIFKYLRAYFYEEASDTSSPVFSSDVFLYELSVNDKKSIEEIKNEIGLRAIDDVDGEIEHINYIDIDDYQTLVYDEEIRNRTLGNYEIEFSAIDISNNCATCTIVIQVLDLEKPVLNSKTSNLEYNLSYKNDNIKSENDLLNGLNINDNYSNVIKTIKENSYKNHERTVGDYEVVVEAKDSSNNKIEVTILIHIIDDVAPLISGENNISVWYGMNLTVEDIIDMCSLVANDEINGECKIVAHVDNYSGNSNVVGSYRIIFKSYDIYNNISYFTVTINVIDETVPHFIIDKTKIIVSSDEVYNLNMFVDRLIKEGRINSKVIKSEVLKDEYTLNSNKTGIYDYEIKLLYENLEEETIRLRVEVKDIKKEEKQSFITKVLFKIKNFFTKDVYQKVIIPVVKFFEKLFDKIF